MIKHISMIWYKCLLSNPYYVRNRNEMDLFSPESKFHVVKSFMQKREQTLPVIFGGYICQITMIMSTISCYFMTTSYIKYQMLYFIQCSQFSNEKDIFIFTQGGRVLYLVGGHTASKWVEKLNFLVFMQLVGELNHPPSYKNYSTL